MQLRLHNEFPDGLWYMSWFDVEESDFGATLGECITDGSGIEPTERGDLEHYIAVKTIASMFPDTQRTTRGWAWNSKREAMTTWKAIQQAMSQERPLPEWAQKALQEGWKPPKGWKA